MLVAAASVIMLADACKRSDAPPVAAPPAAGPAPASPGVVAVPVAARSAKRPAYLASLSEAEFHYGISPTRNPDVTYQPDVIVMEHGADAIRSESANGLGWTLDANSPHVQEIQPGKIMFATGRAVGRVLALSRTGNQVTVTLGPVELTDVVKDAKITFNQQTDVNEMIAYTATDYPGSSADAAPLTEASATFGPGSLGLASYRQQSPFSGTGAAATAAGILAPLVGLPLPMFIGDFRFTPFKSGLGVDVVGNGDDAKIHAYAVFRLDHPTLAFVLDIQHSKIVTAEVTLNGAAGLTVQLEAMSATGGPAGNINKSFFVPVDLSLPIIGKALPIAMTFRQTLLIQTALTVKTSTLVATGDYRFSGAWSAGFRNGSWGVAGPVSFTTNRNLANTMTGESMGVNGMVFAYGARVIVGIGAFGFITGPFVGVNSVVGLTKGSDLSSGVGVPPCRSAILDMSMKVGVGYAIPNVVTNIINAILRANKAPEIEGSGGAGHEQTVVHKADKVPAVCAGGSDTP